MPNMKLSKAERRRMDGPVAAEGSDAGPEYPWGPRIRLETAQLDKLDMPAGLGVGKTIELRRRRQNVEEGDY